MNPQDSAPQPTIAPAVDPGVLRQIIEEMETSNPYGFGKYEETDAAALLGLPLGSLRLAHQLVKQFLGTPFVPKFIAQSANPAGTFLATILRGAELGFKMLESLSCLYLSPDGRLGMYGTAMIALMRKSGVHLEFTEIKGEDGTPFGFTVYGKRKDGDEYTSTFTRADAQRAGITGMHGKYPQFMTKWRATSDLFRTLCPDLSGGPVYSREELEEEVDLGLVVAETEKRQAAPENGTQFKVGRKSAKTNEVPAASSDVAGGEGNVSTAMVAEAAAVDSTPPSESVQTSDKPPFDPTPEAEPPLLKVVAKPDSAKRSESPMLVTVKGIPDAKVKDYLRGFLGVTVVPKTHPNMAAAVEYLASLDPLIVLRDPYALGVDLRDWMNGQPFYGEKLSPADLRAWLRVLARGGFKLAGQFREAAMEDGQPSRIVAEWEEAGMDLSTCTADDIESALQLLDPGPHSPAEALAAAHGDEVPNPFKGLRG